MRIHTFPFARGPFLSSLPGCVRPCLIKLNQCEYHLVDVDNGYLPTGGLENSSLCKRECDGILVVIAHLEWYNLKLSV